LYLQGRGGKPARAQRRDCSRLPLLRLSPTAHPTHSYASYTKGSPLGLNVLVDVDWAPATLYTWPTPCAGLRSESGEHAGRAVGAKGPALRRDRATRCWAS